MEGVKVVSSPLPFSNAQVKSGAAVGSSVQDIVNDTVLEKYQGLVECIVFINGELIPQSAWKSVRPKLGTTVNIRVVPAGGGGGKNPLASILSIAVLVAAPYLGAAAGGALFGGGLGVNAFIAGRVLTGVFSVVGSMLVNAIAPPPKPSSSSKGNPSESPTLFIEGARNSLNPYGVVPVCLGTNRMFPLQCASPYTENQNNNQYVRQMFTYGFGDNIVTSQPCIGDTPLTNYSDYEIERFNSGNLNTGGSLWTNSVIQQNFSLLLRQVDGWSVRSVTPNCDEVVVDYNFFRGLSRFNNNGKRVSHSVRLELQYREVGSTDWIGGVDFQSYSGTTFTPEVSQKSGETRRDIIVINNSTGQIRYIQGGYDYRSIGGAGVGMGRNVSGRPAIPNGSLKIADVDVLSTQQPRTGVITTEITVFDRRDTNLIGVRFQNNSSFVPSKTGTTQVTVSGGGLSDDPLNISAATSEALLHSHRIVFPQRGDYEIRTRRRTADSTDTNIFDLVNLSAIKGVRYQVPVNADNLNGVALRIKATDQLNGSVDQLNEVVSNVVLDYFPETDTWSPAVTSNPASLYRYVLQGEANANPLPNSKIDLEALQEWHIYCTERGYTCNIVIDYETSVQDTLALIAASGSASPAIVGGKRSVVVDRAGKDIVQMITPRNSWGYSGEMIYPQIPHAFRVTFRNAERGYLMDERIVYFDGYDQSNATIFEELELRSCTNAALAYKHARRYMATALLRPETHTFNMDVEHITFLRGDRIKFQHDVPLVGIGNGRIKELVLSGSGDIEGLVLDDTITFPSNGTFYIRIRYSDGSQDYRQIRASIGSTNDITFVNPIEASEAPSLGDLCYVTTAGGELDLIVNRIEPMNDLTARVVCLDYAPEIFDAETGDIPPFDSKITIPLEFIRPLPPILVNQQSDESVMIRNIDGSFTSQAVFTLENQNENTVGIDVISRLSGTSEWTRPKILGASPTSLAIGNLDDNTRYDIHIRYKRENGQYSEALQINNYLFVGNSSPPANVSNFRIEVTGQTALFTWDKNEDIDLSHYEMRFSSLSSGATWATAQTLEERIYENRITLIAQSGTYLIKAVDLSGNYSVNETIITTNGIEGVLNAVAILQEDPDFSGVKDNVEIFDNGLVLIDPSNSGEGYYYFDNSIDLTDIFSSYLSSSFIVGAIFKGGGAGNNDIFAMENLFNVSDIFGISTDGWDAIIEMRTTNDDPEDSGAVWTDWIEFTAGAHEFRAAQFRVWLKSYEENVTPYITQLRINVDMPDRIEQGEDLTVAVSGASITFTPSFKDVPALSILLQDADAGDEIEFISKSTSGFEFRVFNRVSMTYVERIYDFIASGYGRVL